MCGITGIYRPDGIDERHSKAFDYMMYLCESRGTDAWGYYSYPDGKLFKQEGAFSKYGKENMDWHKSLIGNKIVLAHTRSTTKGSEKDNFNNHPFETKDFVMAHNGMLWNDDEVIEKFKIKTDIKTDSYVMIALIQQFYEEGSDVIEAIQKTLKEVRGSVACWLLFKKTGSIFLFRKNNPIYVSYHPKGKFFVFASERGFFEFMEVEGDVKGFRDGLSNADIKENIIYRLTTKGIVDVGKFEMTEYSGWERSRGVGGMTIIKGGKVLNYCDDAYEEEDGYNGKVVTDSQYVISTLDDLDFVMEEEYGVSFWQITDEFGKYGFKFDVKDGKLVVKLEEQSYVYYFEKLKEIGYTPSPFKHEFKVEFENAFDFLFDVQDVIGTMIM